MHRGLAGLATAALLLTSCYDRDRCVPVVLKDVPQGAATEVFVDTHPSVAAVSGEYFADCNVAKARADASDAALAKKLWDVSEKIVAGLK